MKTRKLTFAAMLIAIGVALGNVIYIPVGMSKCFPIQHTINFISAITMGPVYGGTIAFLISLIRNIVGTGSALAFPGSMIGALLSGILYMYSGKKIMAALGEIFGTGILGGLLAFPIAKFFMGQEIVAWFFISPFMLSTVGGTLIGYGLSRIINFEKIFKSNENAKLN